MIDLNIEPLESWSGVKDRPLIIAGPCSAESEEQVMTIAAALKDKGVDYMRAGIWKPRTRPGSFEGIGEPGLKWLARVKNELGMKVGTEVAKPEHVELAMKYGVDCLWVGARTTVNPFAMQELADSMKGLDVPVLVKNPINPDTQLWIGGIERIANAGITKLAAIHRGVSTYEKSKFRNKPMWQMAIDLKRQMPNIPIINDPSHIAGTRELIEEVSQKAMDIGLDGLMIETHHTPDDAWSDAKQQVTPARLFEILGNLQIRKVATDNVEFNTSLDDLRAQIDRIDNELLEVLGERMGIVEQIGQYKSENSVTTLQVARWDALLADRVKAGDKLNLSADFIKDILKGIHKESIRIQSEIAKNVNA